MRLPRKAWIAGGVAALCGAIGLHFAARAAVESRVVSAFESRGFETHVASISVGLFEISVEGLVLRKPGFDVEVEEVQVLGNVLSLYADGARGAERIDVLGTRVAVDLQALETPDAVETDFETSGDTETGATEEEELTLPELCVHVDEARVVDEEGELFFAIGEVQSESDADLAVDLSVFRLGTSGDITEGSSNPGHAFSGDLEAQLERHEEWKVASASVDELEVVVGHQGRLESRLQRASSLLLGGQRSEESHLDVTTEMPLLPFVNELGNPASLHLGEANVRRSSGAKLLSSLSLDVTREGDILSVRSSAEQGDARLRSDAEVNIMTLFATGELELQSLPMDLVAAALPELPWHEPERATMSGSLSLTATPEGEIVMDGELSVADLAIAHPRIAAEPIRHLGFSIDGRASYDPALGRLNLRRAEVRSGSASVALSADFTRREEHWSLTAHGELPSTACADALSAIPADLLDEVHGFSFAGTIGGTLDVAIDSRRFSETRLDFDVRNRCRFLSFPAFADVSRFAAPFVHRVQESADETFEMTTGPGSGNWTPISEMSPFLLQAVIGHEDGGFLRHSGFAPYAIRDALARNLEEGRYVVGASTISMQLVKNVFLHREKTLARKVQEVLLTWWIEHALEKEEILELYLNVIEYGRSVYGITHAAQHFFGRTPSELSVAEATFFATILPSPKRYYEAFERGALSSRMRRRIENFLRHLESRGRIDHAALNDGLAQLSAGLEFRNSSWPAQGETGELPFLTAGELDAMLEGEGWDEPGEAWQEGFVEEDWSGGGFSAESELRRSNQPPTTPPSQESASMRGPREEGVSRDRSASE